MNTAVRIIVLLITAFLSPLQAADLSPSPEFLDVQVTGEYQEFDFDSKAFRADGGARVVYGETTVTADSVGGSFVTGAFDAEGQVVFTQGERIITGHGLVYNYRTRIGSFRDASASIEGFLFRGEELVSSPEGYLLKKTRFTTCDQESPHYYLSAGELRIQPGNRLSARRLRMVAFGNTLFSIPKYSLLLRDRDTAGLQLPSVGFSGRYGFYTEHAIDIAGGRSSTGRMTLRISTRQFLQGSLMLPDVAGTPLGLRAAYLEPHYAGRRSDVLVSRLPELTWQFRGAGDPGLRQRPENSITLSGDLLDPLKAREARSGIGVIAEAGLGYFAEEPSGRGSSRADLRALVWIGPIRLSDTTRAMPAMMARYSRYGTGDDYMSIGGQLAAEHRLGPDSYIALTYLTHAVSGATPFEFDPVEIQEELAARLRYPIGGVSLDLGLRYDVRNDSVFDTLVSVAKRFHCLEPKLTWRNRFREISLSVRLVDI